MAYVCNLISVSVRRACASRPFDRRILHPWSWSPFYLLVVAYASYARCFFLVLLHVQGSGPSKYSIFFLRLSLCWPWLLSSLSFFRRLDCILRVPRGCSKDFASCTDHLLVFFFDLFLFNYKISVVYSIS